jgi:molybdate transport system substrate-binding protein
VRIVSRLSQWFTPRRRLLCLLLSFLASLPAFANEPVTVFAASSLTEVLTEILETAPSGIKVRTSFAGTGTLVRQIEAGAPADIFISANETWTKALSQKNLLTPGSLKKIAGNNLVLISPATSRLPDWGPYHLLQHKDVHRIALGETGSVPAGIYGREVLDHLGLWDALKPILLPADSVRNVLFWVERGEADLGFVYQSDASRSSKVKVRHIFRPSKASNLSPVFYTSALVADRTNLDIQTLYKHLFSEDAGRAFAKHGFQRVS